MLYITVADGAILYVGEDRQKALDSGNEEIKGQKGATFTVATLRDAHHEEVGQPQEEEEAPHKKGKGK